MTFEYMGAHPRKPVIKRWWHWRRRFSDPEEKLEEAPIVAELRVAIVKEQEEEAKNPKEETET